MFLNIPRLIHIMQLTDKQVCQERELHEDLKFKILINIKLG